MKPKRVAIIGADWPAWEKYCPNFLGMQDGLKRLDIEHKLFSCRPELDVKRVIEYKPDFVLYGLLDMVKKGSWRYEIKNGLPNAKIVMWYGDLRNNDTGQIIADLSDVDMMFVSNDAQSDFYQKKWKVKACHFMPLGSPIFDVEYDKRFDFDFVFIGSKITGTVFMDRATEIVRFQENGLRVVNGDARLPELRTKVFKTMPQVYRSSKISLDISHFTDIKGYTSNRFWIIPASGGLAMTKRWPGCTDFYPEDTRIYFDTFEEAIELKERYLKDSVSRETIRLRGVEQAKKHTYDYRFIEIFKKVYTS